MLPLSGGEQASVAVGHRHQRQHHLNLNQHAHNRGQSSPGFQNEQANGHRNCQLKKVGRADMAPGAAIDRGCPAERIQIAVIQKIR